MSLSLLMASHPMVTLSLSLVSRRALGLVNLSRILHQTFIIYLFVYFLCYWGLNPGSLAWRQTFYHWAISSARIRLLFSTRRSMKLYLISSFWMLSLTKMPYILQILLSPSTSKKALLFANLFYWEETLKYSFLPSVSEVIWLYLLWCSSAFISRV